MLRVEVQDQWLCDWHANIHRRRCSDRPICGHGQRHVPGAPSVAWMHYIFSRKKRQEIELSVTSSSASIKISLKSSIFQLHGIFEFVCLLIFCASPPHIGQWEFKFTYFMNKSTLSPFFFLKMFLSMVNRRMFNGTQQGHKHQIFQLALGKKLIYKML